MFASMFALGHFFLFSPPTPGGESPNLLVQYVPFVLIIGVFYFFMIRPQQKKQKDREKLLDTLKKGDRVVTIGGLHGRVFSINAEKKTVVVETGDSNMRLTFDRTAISTIDVGETADKLES
jgi:preprotein translocase subunit YajC